MINVNNHNKMQRHEQVIELSDHVKNKLKQHQHPSASSPFINSSDEFIEVESIDYDHNSLLVMSPDHTNRSRRDTFTTYQVKQPSDGFFTDGKSQSNPNVSILQEKYAKQQQQQQQPPCQECLHRDHVIHLERQRLLHLYNENKKLHEQLRASILLNHQYENDIQKLKHHLRKVNSHLYEYHMNFDHLKQKIESDHKTISNIDEDKQEVEKDKQETTIDHLKRLRYEVNMYNRIVASKQQQQDEKHEQKKVNFLF